MNRTKKNLVDRLRPNAPDGAPAAGRQPRRSLALSSWFRRVPLLCLLVAGVTVLPGCFFFHHGNGSSNLLPAGQQPDKILYERSINEIERGRYDVGRLTLQTLLNTYPDSEYLAKAKLAIANSYYKQGGVAGLTEAEAEYKDFMTFFPTAPEAPMAQYRVAMAHFRLMGKPDRDLSQARLAEAEFKEFLLKYSDSPLMPRASARLREVQEVLAQGNYEVARFYFEKRANPAARSRFKEIVEDYPSFSKADGACWYLAQTFQRLNKPKMAIPYYDRLVALYPLSRFVPKAKEELASLHEPIPQPTMATLARARADARHNNHLSIFQKFKGTFSSSPNLSATRHGPVVVSHATSAI
ncbi:MAG: outer membrane protein assembly factor BamD, partial [Acidobacteriota bacterium]